MGRKSIRKNKSIYMQVREKLGLTRETASELIDGISPSRLEKLETGATVMQPEDVVLMASAYREPMLCNYYCTHECAIGRRNVPELKEKELPQIAIEMVNAAAKLNSQRDMILQIAEDGTVKSDEYHDFEAIRENVDKLVLAAQTLRLWFDKARATGEVGQI